MQGGYPSDWDTRRKTVYKRDNYTCQNCGAKGGPSGNAELHAHHIVPKSKGGTHKLTNIKTMCRGCHSAIHNNQLAPSSSPSRPKEQATSPLTKTTSSQYTYTGRAKPEPPNLVSAILTDLTNLTIFFRKVIGNQSARYQAVRFRFAGRFQYGP
ncbi:HNH endonuclease [Halostagnicola sp. A56]|uniref:HNH endonuclease n=1 Tax=Halostagnicola sp. A56 TaxID=1495067 RepID=UPI0009E1A354|nr:HNH endonuclease signature motif containing protein [Halostagnicola sp. A56]